jgi:hypothetical protein
MKPLSLILMALCGAALAACSNSDRTTSIPRGADYATVQGEPSGFSAPPAPAERGPIPANAITVAPGTDASLAFANGAQANAIPEILPKDAHVAVRAEEAAARAPDTASGDAAKKAMIGGPTTAAAPGNTARDTPDNSPRNGTLTPDEESTQMPKAGQANNHSSPSLEQDSGR